MDEKRRTNNEKWQQLIETLEEDALEIAETFCADSVSNIEKLRAAGRNQDYASVNRIAHSLKSSSGIFGARDLAELCYQVERDALKHSPELLDEIEAVASELKAVTAEITERVNEYQKGKFNHGI